MRNERISFNRNSVMTGGSLHYKLFNALLSGASGTSSKWLTEFINVGHA